jgi:early secretory antigenic target protein ESAT-6
MDGAGGGSEMKYNFGSLDTLASSIDTRVSTINGIVEDLRSQVNNLTATYQGAANDGFQQTRAKWNGAATDLNGVLARISSAVKVTREESHSTEMKNAGRWQS